VSGSACCQLAIREHTRSNGVVPGKQMMDNDPRIAQSKL